MTTDSRAYLGNLHQLLDQHFDLEDMRTLCVHLSVDYDSVRGEGKSARVRELIVALARNGRLNELLTLAEAQRPHIQWPPIPSDFQLPASLDSSTTAPSIQHVYLGDVIHGDRIGGDRVSVGHISDSQGVAIGREAGATVKHQAKNVADKLASLAPGWWPGNPHYFAPGVAALLILIMAILVVSLRPRQPEGLASSPPAATNPSSFVEVFTPPSIPSPDAITTPATPTETPTGVPTPTPGVTGENRPPDVIIAEFETRPGETVRVARRLEENLYEQLQIYGLSDVNVMVVNEPVLDREQAENLTTELAGKVLIWGWYDDVGVRVRIHLPESHQGNLQALRLRELPLAQAGSDSSELAFLVNGPLPQNVTFLSLFIIGQLNYQANEYEAGYAAFDAAMANLPETIIFENEALLYFFRARQLERTGDENAADVICDYARAIALDPSFASAYNNLGVFLASQQLSTEVRDTAEPCLTALPFEDADIPRVLFSRAAELEPNSVLIAYNILALDYAWEGSSNISTETIDEIITRDPSIPGPYILSGILAVQENDLVKAETRFQAVVGQLPELRLNLALVYLLQDRPQDARPILEEMMVEDPADAEAMLALAYLVYHQEGVESAQYYLEQIPPLEQVYSMEITPEEQEPSLLPDGFHEAGYVTSPVYMAALFRSFSLFEAGDIVGATTELEGLILTAERVFQASGNPDYLPLERYLLSLLYALGGLDEASQNSWQAITPLDLLYTVTAQAATARAWETLEVICNDSSDYLSTPDWLTLDNPCLPEPLHERITAVFMLFVEQLPGRISHEVAGFLGGQACPFVFTYDVERQRWVRDNVILHELVGAENERTQWRQLNHFDGRLLIRELEPEISYLNEVYVVAIDATGRQVILQHDFAPLQAADSHRWVMWQGDQLLITFAGYETLADSQQFWVVATGYYLPLPVD